MIVEYTEQGMIFHVINDPVPEGLADFMAEKGRVFLDIPWSEDSIKVDNFKDYIDVTTLEVKRRPEFNVPEKVVLNVGESQKLTGLPDKFEITLDGQVIPIEGGELELDGDMPGTYFVYIRSFPYLDKMIELTVNED